MTDDFNLEKAYEELLASLEKPQLIQDSGQYDEQNETLIRNMIKAAAGYSEDGPTFDPTGAYLCGTCALRIEPNVCAWVGGPITMDSGGCILYFGGQPIAEKPLPNQFEPQEVLYTERPNDKSFGCAHCMFGAQAQQPDTEGRNLWCGFWGCHVMEVACCYRNKGKDDVMPGQDEDQSDDQSDDEPKSDN